MKPEQTARRDIALFKEMANALFSDYRRCHDRWEQSQVNRAEGFNLLEIMGVDTKELCHSRLLEWLFARELGQGTHAQGRLGFRLFLEEIGLNPSYADTDYWVRREVVGENSRIDVEIAADKDFIIHIENKIDAPEFESETPREWKGLEDRGNELKIPPKRRHAIFLTLDGRAAEAKEFAPLPWSRVARVVEKFAERAKAPDVRLFARHYASVLGKLSVSNTIEEERLNATPEIHRTGTFSSGKMGRRI